MSWSQVTLSTVPNCQYTMLERVVLSAMSWTKDIRAVNIAEMARPERTIVSGDVSVSLTRASMIPVASMANAKEQSIVVVALSTEIVTDVRPVTLPPFRNIMAKAPPNADALDMPSVLGEAIGLRRMVCMTAPDTPRIAPPEIAARIGLSLRSQTVLEFHVSSGKMR